MLDLFASAQNDLGRAGWLILLEIFGAAVIAATLSHLGIATDYLFLCVLAFNLLPTWYIFKAAKRQRKSALLYGVVSMLGGIVAAWAWLYSQDQWSLLEHKYRAPGDEA